VKPPPSVPIHSDLLNLHYTKKSKEVQKYEVGRENGNDPSEVSEEIKEVYNKIRTIKGFEDIDPNRVGIGSTIFANKPGDGSAREQAASCQRVIGAWANLAMEYATKRYRSNLINWGMVPFLVNGAPLFNQGEFVFIPNLRNAISEGKAEIKAYAVGDAIAEFTLSVGDLTEEEKSIIIAGCLINHYKTQK